MMVAFKVIVLGALVLSALYAFAGKDEEKKNGRWLTVSFGALFIAAEIVTRIFA